MVNLRMVNRWVNQKVVNPDLDKVTVNQKMVNRARDGKMSNQKLVRQYMDKEGEMANQEVVNQGISDSGEVDQKMLNQTTGRGEVNQKMVNLKTMGWKLVNQEVVNQLMRSIDSQIEAKHVS